MFGQNEYLKVLFCILVLFQLVQCKHYRKHPADARLHKASQLNLRHNTEDYHQATSAGEESLEPSDEATLAPDGHDVHDDIANEDEEEPDADKPEDPGISSSNDGLQTKKDYCWMKIKSSNHFRNMDKVSRVNSSIADGYKSLVKSSDFDQEMLKKMLETRSIADRTLQNFGGAVHMVPAGLNLGGYEMIELPPSVLFFHRLKLRNDTRFSVEHLHNDLQEMTLRARINMHDLHLVGDYERAIRHEKDRAYSFFYTPTSGEVDLLLRNVQYEMEGRYRLLHDHLQIEHIISTMTPQEVAVKFASEKGLETLKREDIKSYLRKMQNDLDSWLQDYFNDFLVYFGLGGAAPNKEYQSYQNSRTIELNRFADEILENMRRRIRQIGSGFITPDVTLFAINGLNIKMSKGVVYGLESVHRRSAATGRREGHTRLLTAVVGFSLLKVEYDYEILASTGIPPLFGKFVLTADGQTARIDAVVAKDSDVIDLKLHILKEPPSLSLVVVGPANRVIGNFKHLLEHQIIAIMTNCLYSEIQRIKTVTKCDPELLSYNA